MKNVLAALSEISAEAIYKYDGDEDSQLTALSNLQKKLSLIQVSSSLDKADLGQGKWRYTLSIAADYGAIYDEAVGFNLESEAGPVFTSPVGLPKIIDFFKKKFS